LGGERPVGMGLAWGLLCWLALWAPASAVSGETPQPLLELEIVSPRADEIVWRGTELTLSAVDYRTGAADVRWMVRAGDCEAGGGIVAGNVEALHDPYTWDRPYFFAAFAAVDLLPGVYCFIFDSHERRAAQRFYVAGEAPQ
jgi:hypothetical protein